MSSIACLVFSICAESIAQLNQPYDVHVKRDIEFLGKGREERLDLYIPQRDGASMRPAVIIVHGGGWFGGDKAARRETNIGRNLAAAGYVCASINYQLSDPWDRMTDRLRQVWPQNLHDCKTAVRFLRRHADRYHVDADHIGAIGGSAGGHLTALMATTAASDGLDPAGPYAEFSCRIQAFVALYGVHDVLEQIRIGGGDADMSSGDIKLCREASPILYVTPDDPPALIMHGGGDVLVPLSQSQSFFNRLAESDVTATLTIVAGAPHSFHLQPKEQDLRASVIAFLNQHLRSNNAGLSRH